MSWKNEFNKKWNRLCGSHRWDRAVLIVENGIRTGKSLVEIAAATEGEHEISDTAVSKMVDLYALGKGAGQNHGRRSFSGGEIRVGNAIRAFKEDVYEDEISAFVKQNPRVKRSLAFQVVEGMKVGKALDNKGWIDDSGKILMPDPRSKTGRTEMVKSGLTPPPLPRPKLRPTPEMTDEERFDNWCYKFGNYSSDVDAFIGFLKDTKQDDMRDSTFGKRLRRMASALVMQADRLDIGYEKYRAKRKMAQRKRA